MLYLRDSFLSHNYPVEEAEVCIIGIPFDSTSLGRGSGYAPTAIREALKLIEGHDPESGYDIFEKIRISDLGDIEVVPGSYELTAERVRDTINAVKEANPGIKFLFLGGEHLISLAVIEALEPDTVIDFDAHADLRKDFLGNEFSHASWASHILEKVNLVQRGVRSFSEEEKKLMRRLGKKIKGSCYLTIDMDVFDPALVQDTGLPEPGGWDWEEFCRNLKDVNNLVGADLVELSPREFNSPSAILAANVVKKVLALFK